MPAKYTLLNEPAIQRMLHQERIAALEKALTLIGVQLMRGDQILVLRYGEIAELLARGGLYKEIYDLQFRGQEAEVALER